jgi:hypothetical protein
VQEIEVFIATAQHLLFGHVHTGGNRLQEVLNNSSTDFLKLRNVSVFRGATTSVRTAQTMTIAKQHIAFATITGDRYEAPEKRQYAFADKKHCTCFIVVQGYELEGIVNLKGSVDPIIALRSELSDFFPIAEPKIGNIGTHQNVPATVAMVNKSMVSVIEIASPQPAETVLARLR